MTSATSTRSAIRTLIDSVTPAQAAIGFVLLGIGVLIGGSLNLIASEFWTGTTSNLGVEFLSIAITVLVIDGLNKREAKREKVSDLVLQMQSKENLLAVAAVDQLRTRGWMQADSLEGEYITGANLENVNLQWANLQRAQVSQTNLANAHLDCALLQGASLTQTNLDSASLKCADLKSAVLNEVSLRGADLTDANLEGMRLILTFINPDYAAYFDENTVMPDGSRWVPDTDIDRFTDPHHSHFWRSKTTFSPAYAGN